MPDQLYNFIGITYLKLLLAPKLIIKKKILFTLFDKHLELHISSHVEDLLKSITGAFLWSHHSGECKSTVVRSDALYGINLSKHIWPNKAEVRNEDNNQSHPKVASKEIPTMGPPFT